MTYEVRRVPVLGAKLKYVETGQGDAVVLVHGAVSDHRFWRGQFPALSPSYRCIALDQRYFGDEPWTDSGSQYSLATHSSDLGEFISRVVEGPAHIVATSYGSAVAIDMALHRPELVRSLFLYEPALGSLVEEPNLLAEIAEERKGLAPSLHAQSLGDTHTALDRFMEWITGDPRGLDVFPAEFRRMLYDNARTFGQHFSAPPVRMSRADLARLRRPLTLVQGEVTLRAFAIVAGIAQSTVAGSRLLILPGAHHVGPYQRASEFNALLLEHLLRHGAAA